MIPGAKICPTPGCPAPHIHYFKHECHHIGSNGGCVVCDAHFCYQVFIYLIASEASFFYYVFSLSLSV